MSTPTEESSTSTKTTLFCHPGHYSVVENCGTMTVTVVREGRLDSAVQVDFATEDGVAKRDKGKTSFQASLSVW